jgi:hypothetical protein
MSRSLCLALVVVSLAAAPGCSSCFGSSCRRPSFMEFRSPCSGRQEAAPVCAPACEPACGPACGAAPCCEGGAVSGGVGPSSTPVVVGEQGTFS